MATLKTFEPKPPKVDLPKQVDYAGKLLRYEARLVGVPAIILYSDVIAPLTRCWHRASVGTEQVGSRVPFINVNFSTAMS